MLPEICDNAFAGRLSLEGYQSLAIAVMNFLMIPCTLIANVVVIVGLCRTKQLGSTVNNLFLCLSVSDSCIAVIVQSLVGALFTFYRQELNCGLETTTQFLTFLFGHVSGFTIVAIGIDRYVHMKYLQRYESIMTRKRAKILIGFSFTAAIVMGSAYMLSTIYDIFQWVNMAILLADLSAVIMIYIAYIEAYLKVKMHIENTKALRRGRRNAPLYAISMIKTILLILCAVFICYVPYVIAGMMGFYQVQIKKMRLPSVTAFFIYLTYELVYLNSLLNAVIFIYKNDQVRRFFLGVLQFAKKSRSESRANSSGSVQLSTITTKSKFMLSCESFPTMTSNTADFLADNKTKEESTMKSL